MKRLALLLVFAVLAVVEGCKTNPRTGRGQMLIYSSDQMNKLGAQAYLEMTGPGSKVKIETDTRLTAPLRRVGAAVSAAANVPEWDGQWEYKLIRAKSINAWALPGGKIAFYTGIYPILKDEAGMAIVMGHEVMHAILEHGNERMSQAALTTAAVAAASIGFHDSEYRNEIVGALGAGAAYGVILPFSRKHESEADEFGLYLAARAGYDPEAAIGVWERMAKLSEGKRTPELLSTHPDPLHRIENMKRWMPKARELYNKSNKQPNRPLPPVR